MNKNQNDPAPITVADAVINPVKEEKDDRPFIQVNKQKLTLLVKKLQLQGALSSFQAQDELGQDEQL